MMPYSDKLVLYQIIVQFTLEDGKTETLVTKVVERDAAKSTYSDALQRGETAVVSFTESTN
jgi:hypothetical protein